jgi:hypothetical protein
MVKRNAKQVDKRRKKEGKPSVAAKVKQADRYQGRNYMFPVILVLIMIFYVILFAPWANDLEQDVTMFWLTLGAYLLLALFYFLRRPYLTVTRDSLETRRFTGYKTLRPGEIRKISLSPGYVVIESVKGSNWVFSRVMNLYPIERMGERLKAFAEQHHIELEIKAK